MYTANNILANAPFIHRSLCEEDMANRRKPPLQTLWQKIRAERHDIICLAELAGIVVSTVYEKKKEKF